MASEQTRSTPARAARAAAQAAKDPSLTHVLPDRQRAALVEIREGEAEQAKVYARRVRARYEMNQLWEDAPTSGNDVFLELAGTARVGQTRAATELSDAARLVEVFRETLAGLEAGVIWQPAAELLLTATRRCTEQISAEVERRVLARLREGNTTELRPLLQQTVLQAEADLDPEALEKREQQAKDDRAVWINPIEDGMCQVGATMQDLDGQRWCLDFEELVRAQAAAAKAAGRVRTRNQRRADVFAALPSQLLALLQAIASGQTAELLAMAKQDPLAAEDLEHLAEQVRDLLPTDTDTDPSHPEPSDTEPSDPDRCG